MANSEPTSEFYSSIGVEKKEGQEIRSYLEEKVISTLNKFPFSPPGTENLPILSFNYNQEPEPGREIILLGLEKGIMAASLEKLMDNVLIAKSVFNGDYAPVKSIPEHVDPEKRKLRKSWNFPITIEGGRLYIVTKEVDYTKEIIDGKMTDKLEKIRYFASLPQVEDLIPEEE